MKYNAECPSLIGFQWTSAWWATLAVALMGATVAISTGLTPGTPTSDADAQPIPAPDGWDPTSLDPDPLPAWGVVNAAPLQDGRSIEVLDIADTAGRVYAGGAFTGVQRNGFDPSSQVMDQSYLAAFDIDSGAWIPSFAPTFDGAVFSIEVLPNGNLIVGGEFTTVNGQSRTGIVSLDPITGAVEPGFVGMVESWWNDGKDALVREIDVVGTDVYLVGNFDHVRLGDNSYRVWSTSRLRAGSGQLDPS